MLRSLLLATLVLGLSAAGCRSTDEARVAPTAALQSAATGEAFRLEEGEAVQVDGHALRFDSVVEDSRCPANTTCVWEGRAKVRLTASASGGASDTTILTVPMGGRLAEGETNAWTVGGVTVTVLELMPYPGTEAAESEAPVEVELMVEAAG